MMNGSDLDPAHLYAREPRPRFLIADGKKVRTERREPNGDKQRRRKRAQRRAQETGTPKMRATNRVVRPAGRPESHETAERQKNSGPIDAE